MKSTYRSSFFAVIAAAGLLGAFADVSFGAIAKRTGGSGYSGALYGNKAQRKQELICDPNEPTAGSTSTTYDPTIVSLTGFTYGPGFSGQAYVEVSPIASFAATPAGQIGPFLQSISSFLVRPAGARRAISR